MSRDFYQVHFRQCDLFIIDLSTDCMNIDETHGFKQMTDRCLTKVIMIIFLSRDQVNHFRKVEIINIYYSHDVNKLMLKLMLQ